jgi:peptidoglycan/LPS O-acetylase OafA/YrhL
VIATPTTGAAAAPRQMSRQESLYLDLIRALAALVVVLDHAQNMFDIHFLPRIGHQAVIIFFVLSGYVISYVADTREPTASKFVIARLARLWSVLVPAIILTIVCDFVGMRFGLYPETYADTPMDWPLVRVFATLGFLTQTWVSIELFSNVAIWSLSVEFWYYMLFAAWTFAPSSRLRVALVFAAVLFTGYKGLLLLPIWLTGVALQRWRILDQLPSRAYTALFFGCGALALLYMGANVYSLVWGLQEKVLGAAYHDLLLQARVFWLDWIFGLVVAGHLIGARRLAQGMGLEHAAKAIRWCAGISFAMYLFHAPLLHLSRAFLPADNGALAIVLTLLAIAAIGRPVEMSKRTWVISLESLWAVISRALSAVRARRDRDPVKDGAPAG